MPLTLHKDFAGYPAGTVLRDVPLRTARNMECNRCGGCCAGDLDDETVLKDEATGLPLFTWGKKFPEDLYEQRYGRKMLQPIVMGDGGIELGSAFERDADDVPYTAFRCAFFSQGADGCGNCELYGKGNPRDLSTMRPRNCGEFPVFGLDVDAAIIEHGYFVPPLGALPKCTWYGIRIVGPWKDTPYWKARWEAQREQING